MTAAALLCAALAAPGPPADEPDLPPGVLAYEPFDLGPGEPVLGSDGGLGWAGPWEASDWSNQGGRLDYSRQPRRADRLAGAEEPLEVAGLTFVGGAAATPALYPDIGVLTRRIRPRLGRPGSTVYLGLLVRADGTLHRGTGWGFLTVTLDCGADAYGEVGGVGVTFGKPCDPARTARGIARGGEWCLGSNVLQQALRVAGRPYPTPGTPAGVLHGGGLSCGGARLVTTGVPVAAGPITQLVLKIEYARRRGERYGLFVNPDPSKPDPPPPAAIAIDVLNHGRRRFPTWVTLAGSGAFTVDELRVADSLAGACGYSPPADGGAADQE